MNGVEDIKDDDRKTTSYDAGDDGRDDGDDDDDGPSFKLDGGADELRGNEKD